MSFFFLAKYLNPENRKIEERGQVIEEDTEPVAVDLKPHIIIAASLLVTGILFFTASIILVSAYCKSKKMKISETDEESGNVNSARKSGMTSNNIRYVMRMFILIIINK